MWVRKGLVQVWEGPRPKENTGPDLIAYEKRRRGTQWEIKSLRRQRIAAFYRVCCDLCGCLRFPDEVCPGCLARDRIDEVAIRRRLDGDKGVRLSIAEQNEAWRIWQARGGTLNGFERTTGICASRVRKRIEAA